MAINAKHIATFLFGAAAGLALSKYLSMSTSEKQKLAADLKEKANTIKADAGVAFDKAKDYFDELKTKGTETFKEHFGDVEKTVSDLFGKKEKPASDV